MSVFRERKHCCNKPIKNKLDSLFIRDETKGQDCGVVRVNLFARFYERLLKEYFKNVCGFEVMDGKPRVFWRDIDIPSVSPANKYHERLISELKMKKKSNENGYCIPDGLFIKEGKYFLWEAKNWIPELFEKNPFSKHIWTFPWLLTKKVNYRGKYYEISGFIISWWDREEGMDEVLETLRAIVSPLTVDIVFTKDVLCECISKKYGWYVSMIEELSEMYQRCVAEFFEVLLGE